MLSSSSLESTRASASAKSHTGSTMYSKASGGSGSSSSTTSTYSNGSGVGGSESYSQLGGVLGVVSAARNDACGDDDGELAENAPVDAPRGSSTAKSDPLPGEAAAAEVASETKTGSSVSSSEDSMVALGARATTSQTGLTELRQKIYVCFVLFFVLLFCVFFWFCVFVFCVLFLYSLFVLSAC